ncbi:PIG-L deacetylase family protein [Kineococcus siccus]|uniref:PIG-L deacetylase family protein n=1 Tax=Kineococcus siccus TaxID=2696567 RepID=UPI0030B7FADA
MTRPSGPVPGARTVAAVSPHLDDAAFSAGGLLAGLAAAGADVCVVTVFTASVPHPTGFALACQLDKGLDADVDYLALRRAEDVAATAALGVRHRHLDLREAPHRGYGDAAALFGPVVAADDVTPPAVAALVAAALAEEFPTGLDLVLGPQALGDHVDHRHVRDALPAVAERVGALRSSWADTPYLLRDGAASPQGGPRAPSPAELSAKVEACAAYATQVGFQFSGTGAMAAALRSTPEFFTTARA